MGADLVIAEATARGCDVYRFNSEDYPATIGLTIDPLDARSPRLLDSGGPVSLARAGIWIRRPQWPRISELLDDPLDVELAEQESIAAFGGMLRAIAHKCVSPADALQSSRWKINQLHAAKRLGFTVPDTLVTTDATAARTFLRGGASVIKAVADARVGEGAQERVGLTQEIVEPDLSGIEFAPVLLQRRVRKVSDLRVTAVGRRLFGVAIRTPHGADLDFRSAAPGDCEYSAEAVNGDLERLCLGFLDHFGLLFGAFDFAIDVDGVAWFLECNPAGQWGWLEAYVDVPITAALVQLLLDLR